MNYSDYNKQMIDKYIDQYKETYFEKYKEYPSDWFTFFDWLSKNTLAQSFDNENVKYTKERLGNNLE